MTFRNFTDFARIAIDIIAIIGLIHIAITSEDRDKRLVSAILITILSRRYESKETTNKETVYRDF
jgi:hypothetical protein